MGSSTWFILLIATIIIVSWIAGLTQDKKSLKSKIATYEYRFEKMMENEKQYKSKAKLESDALRQQLKTLNQSTLPVTSQSNSSHYHASSDFPKLQILRLEKEIQTLKQQLADFSANEYSLKEQIDIYVSHKNALNKELCAEISKTDNFRSQIEHLKSSKDSLSKELSAEISKTNNFRNQINDLKVNEVLTNSRMQDIIKKEVSESTKRSNEIYSEYLKLKKLDENRKEFLEVLLQDNAKSMPWLAGMMADYMTYDLAYMAKSLDWGSSVALSVIIVVTLA